MAEEKVHLNKKTKQYLVDEVDNPKSLEDSLNAHDEMNFRPERILITVSMKGDFYYTVVYRKYQQRRKGKYAV